MHCDGEKQQEHGERSHQGEAGRQGAEQGQLNRPPATPPQGDAEDQADGDVQVPQIGRGRVRGLQVGLDIVGAQPHRQYEAGQIDDPVSRGARSASVLVQRDGIGGQITRQQSGQLSGEDRRERLEAGHPPRVRSGTDSG